MENVVTDGWTITPNNAAGGFDATFWVAGYGMVAVWQPDWASLLDRLRTYNADGRKVA